MLAVIALVFIVLPIVEITRRDRGRASHRRSQHRCACCCCSRSSGYWLAKREGFSVMRHIQRATREPHRARPTSSSKAALVFVGGVLLVVPGFVTDALGPAPAVPAHPPPRRAACCATASGSRSVASGRATDARRHHRRLTSIGDRRAASVEGRRSSGTTGQSLRDAASGARCTPRGPAMQSTRASRELLDRCVVVVGTRRRSAACAHDVVETGGQHAADAADRPTPRAPRIRACRARRWSPRERGTARARSPTPARGSRTTSVSVGSHGSTMRTPRSLARRRSAGAGLAPSTRSATVVEVEPFDHREIDRLGPTDHRDHLILVEQRERRAEPVGSAIGLEQPRRFARSGARIGRGEDAGADPPQRPARPVMREHAPARDHEAGRLRREARRARRRLRSRAGPRRRCGE